MRKFGLIGYPLSHSFSGKYFAEKFDRENIQDASYELFELADIKEVSQVFALPELKGFNITIPYKHAIIDYLDRLDDSAQKVGAVNVVKIASDGSRIGCNSDYYGFKQSLINWIGATGITQMAYALVLGTGGASKAVIAVLKDLGIEYKVASRSLSNGDLTYEQLNEHPKSLDKFSLVINTTPLGTWPNTLEKADLPYGQITESMFLYDLIYNPKVTAFMQEGSNKNAKVKNGHEMLVLQAERSWEIWNA